MTSAAIPRISGNGLSSSSGAGAGAVAGAADVAAGVGEALSAAASPLSPPAFWRGADAVTVGHGGGVLGVGRADPARDLAVVVGLQRLPDDLALLLRRRGQEGEAREAVGGLSSPCQTIASRLPSEPSRFVRFQPGGSSNENGSTSLGICSVTSTVLASRSPGTITSNSTGSPGAATVGRTWTWAAAGAASAAAAATAAAMASEASHLSLNVNEPRWVWPSAAFIVQLAL